jgi:hypothetical protein
MKNQEPKYLSIEELKSYCEYGCKGAGPHWHSEKDEQKTPG